MLGFQEVVLIFAIILLVVGPTKLPELARAIGKGVREFNKASRGLAEAVQSPVEEVKRELTPGPVQIQAPGAVQTPTSGLKGKPIKQGEREVTVEKEETPAEGVKDE